MSVKSDHLSKYVYFAVFSLSGFAGLIYESIWSHYLKLFLGHAAYAQTLVLVIFMGGMALGAWFAAKYSRVIRNPLLGYAVAELLIGLMGLVFHPIFVAVTDFIYSDAIPSLSNSWWITCLKWGVGALLILPQSMLLGSTFPLMSAGVLRVFPGLPGRSLSFLYFTNSLGAAIGVIASGFVLIHWVGLPGTILTAAVINILLALIVWFISRDIAVVSTHRLVSNSDATLLEPQTRNTATLMMMVALLTGAASFLYEIGWIRMLSLVLGASTHSFELMLSAFIFGLAMGSFWIRRRIDEFQRPLLVLGWIQVLMGLAALSTLASYGQSFNFMSVLISALRETEQGYVFFNLFSHGICLAIMVPVTFLAGMTLPMITKILLDSGHGESSIGKIYAANTVGAILGVLFAVHVVMPMFGLKHVIVAGAFIDICLGGYLLVRGGVSGNKKTAVAFAACATAAIAISIFVQLDAGKMASGVFRDGTVNRGLEVLFHKDGKTASVDVSFHRPSSLTFIATNGKPDASISSSDRISKDEPVQVMAAALPVMLLPESKEVAVIGIGSGRTTHTFLAMPGVRSVDTIEIEPAMVEGARLFGNSVSNTFNDPRSHIHIEDAKTFFQLQKKQYDVIVSEPSNPWVSGVSSLYTSEFYQRISPHLSDGGLFVQWLQLYLIDMPLVASIMQALGPQFDDYAVYLVDDHNVLIVARRDGSVPQLSPRPFEVPAMQALLKLIKVPTLFDAQQRYLGDKQLLEPFFASYHVNANSDYFPILDLNAAKAHFLKSRAVELEELYAPISLLETTHDETAFGDDSFGLVSDSYLEPANHKLQVQVAADYIAWQHLGGKPPAGAMDGLMLKRIMNIRSIHSQCESNLLEGAWLDEYVLFIEYVAPYATQQQVAAITADLKSSACYSGAPEFVRAWTRLFEALGQRNYVVIGQAVDAILASNAVQKEHTEFLVSMGMLARIKHGQSAEAVELFNSHRQSVPMSTRLRFLLAYASAQES